MVIGRAVRAVQAGGDHQRGHHEVAGVGNGELGGVVVGHHAVAVAGGLVEDDAGDLEADAAGAEVAKLLENLVAGKGKPVVAAIGGDDHAAGPHGPRAVAAVGGQTVAVEVELQPGFGEVAGFREAPRGPFEQALDEQGAEPVGVEDRKSVV
jgi:hypothetical protein